MHTIGILLLHGFDGNPEEVLPLARILEERGYQVVAPLLPGHGGEKKELAHAKGADWISCAWQAYCDLERACDKTAIIGFSMGGLLGARLCAKEPVHALVTINTPVYYWNIPQILRNLKKDCRVYFRSYLSMSLRKPLWSLIQFQRLLRSSRQWFSQVNCPALVIRTEDDDTVQPKSAQYIFAQMAGEKELLRYPEGGHAILQSPQLPRVAEDVIRFLQKHALGELHEKTL